jgi:hypothetical protein
MQAGRRPHVLTGGVLRAGPRSLHPQALQWSAAADNGASQQYGESLMESINPSPMTSDHAHYAMHTLLVALIDTLRAEGVLTGSQLQAVFQRAYAAIDLDSGGQLVPARLMLEELEPSLTGAGTS